MQIIPRYYQEKAVRQGKWYFENYHKPFVLVLPTGSGKSVVISELCHQLDEPILILQPTQEILEQNYQKLINYGITDIGIYSASFKRKEVEKFTYATIGSIYRKPELFKHFKKVIIDECDLVNPRNIKGMYNKFFKAIDCKDICGLTATPYRMMQKFFKEGEDLFYTSSLQTITRIHPFFFKKIAYEISIKELMEKEYLAKLDYRYYKDFDTSKLRINTTGGDYDAEDLERFWDDERLKKMSKVIYDIDKECNYNLIFCSSIRQANAGCEMLRAMGLNAEYITSKHNNKDRERIINDFRNGKIKHLLNVNVMSCGFDFPQLDSITLARPTISLRLYYQQIGRGIRPYTYTDGTQKKCKVIDLTNNVKKLGRIETIELAKEDGYKDIVKSEVGIITGKPLFTFKIKDEEKKQKYLENINV